MRRWLSVCCALLSGLAGPATAKDGDVSAPAPPMKKSRLAPTRWKYKKVRFQYRLADGKKLAEKPGVRKGRVDRLNVLFVDVDGDGRFDEEGVDGWALTGMNYVLPLEKTAVIELLRVTWKVEADGSFVHWRARRVAVDPAQNKTFRQFNYWRLINGLPPVDFDPEVSSWCTEHCAWMEKNGFKHYAEEGDAPMTEKGELAGRRSMLSQEKPGMSVLMTYASFYHRLPLMNPGTRAIGIGHSARYTAIDGKTRVEERLWSDPVIVPAPGSALQPTHFPPEAPRPYPPQIKQPGFPITLTFRDGATFSEVRAKLERVVRRGAFPVPVLVSWPGNPANKKRQDNRKTICIIPRAPLAPKSLYRVTLHYKQDGDPHDRRWVFTTGRRRPVWPGLGR